MDILSSCERCNKVFTESSCILIHEYEGTFTQQEEFVCKECFVKEDLFKYDLNVIKNNYIKIII